MTELKTARQFEALTRLQAELAAMGGRKRGRRVAENRQHYLQWLAARFPGEGALETVVARISCFAQQQATLNKGVFEELGALTSGWRAEALAPVTGHHRPLPAERMHAALDRLLEWMGGEAFGELHPLEQAALTLARLLEIGPFARFNFPMAEALSSFWPLRAGLLFPVWEHAQPEKYDAVLDAAFRLEMQPLVDHLLRGERRALQMALD